MTLCNNVYSGLSHSGNPRHIWNFFIIIIFVMVICDQQSLMLQEIQPVHSEGDRPWDFFGRNDAKAETPVLWPPHTKSWLIGEDSDAGRDWGQEEKGTTEDEMAGWHHWLDGRESEWTPGAGDGQGRPGVLRFMGSQRVGHDWATDLIWSDYTMTCWRLRWWLSLCTNTVIFN